MSIKFYSFIQWLFLKLFSIAAEPLPLMDLCRRVIRQQVGKANIERGKLDDLSVPKAIRDYLQYKDRRWMWTEPFKWIYFSVIQWSEPTKWSIFLLFSTNCWIFSWILYRQGYLLIPWQPCLNHLVLTSVIHFLDLCQAASWRNENLQNILNQNV